MKKLTYLLPLLLLVMFTACEDDLCDTSIAEITDDITVNTTWYADSVYVIKGWDIWVTATLTIEAGTVIKFTDDGPGLSVGDGGTIVAVGSSDDPIVFTSIKDDAHAGDCNGDGDATSPAARDWGIIWVEANGSRFEYCEFYYGGNSNYPATLEFYDVSGTVKNSVFAHNYGGKSGDFYYGVLSADEATNSIVIKDNIFYDNNLPLSIPAENSLDASNTFHNPDDASEINTMNGIFVYASSEFNIGTTWSETEVPYVINDHDLYIVNSWVLAPNVIVKFTQDGNIIKEPSATFTFDGTNYFTSFRDDAHGGDTNGDGPSSGVNGDWYGLEINDGINTPICGANILYSVVCH